MSHVHNPQSLHQPHAEPAPAIIELEDLCFAYEQTPVLRHIDLSVAPGECVVLMGDNGSGKSTLLRVLCGLLFAQRGSYRLGGQEVSEATMRDTRFSKGLHQRVGFVFQDSDSQLFCTSVADEIAFGPQQMGLSQEEVDRRVSDVCQLLEIDHLRTRAPYTLSGGEKKRVAIACVLSMNPDVYCFDEPLAGLDAKSRAWLLGLLKDLKAAGKTLVIATHDQSLADEVADFFAYMGEFHGYEDRPHVHINE